MTQEISFKYVSYNRGLKQLMNKKQEISNICVNNDSFTLDNIFAPFHLFT